MAACGSLQIFGGLQPVDGLQSDCRLPDARALRPSGLPLSDIFFEIHEDKDRNFPRHRQDAYCLIALSTGVTGTAGTGSVWIFAGNFAICLVYSSQLTMTCL